MKRLTILFPLSGDGSRFKSEKMNIYKPLIEAYNKPILKYAIESILSLNLKIDLEFIFIIREDHRLEFSPSFNFDLPIKSKTVVLYNRTKGALDTIYQSLDHIETQSFLICDCDLIFRSTGLTKHLTENPSISALSVFQSDSGSYSYVKANGEDVTQIAEKKTISQNAVAGCYYFSNVNTVRYSIEKILKDNSFLVKNEFYISAMISFILKNNLEPIKIIELDSHICLGTPDKLSNKEIASFA